MSDKISVILELTEHETSALRSLLLRGVDWRQSGEFGKAIEAIYISLEGLVPLTPSHAPHQPSPYSYPVWKII